MEKQNSELKFEAGKKYKHVSRETIPDGVTIDSEDGSFTCHDVILRCCMSMDVEFMGESLSDGQGWCAAGIAHLHSGDVVEVTP